MTFEETLAEWMPTQRWFAGKGAQIHDLTIVADTVLASGEPGLRHLIVAVTQDGGVDFYQLLLGLRTEVPDHLHHVLVGVADDGRLAYDGLHDPELTRLLLRAFADSSRCGPLSFHREPGADVQTDLDSLVLTGEQSNTSLIFGETSILKMFRRPSPGPNPDLEVPRALARRGSPHVAAPLGWIDTQLGGAPTVLGILSSYLRAASDGWSLVAASVRDLYAEGGNAADAGGDFSGEAFRLGEATAEVHRDLAAAFGTEDLPAETMSRLADQMFDRLDQAIATVPELGQHADLLGAAFADLAKLDGSLRVQRIHGDYHLGQVMRTQTGWVLLDFEGEPATPLAQRRGMAPALRDVAGMLRSFDYAARYQLLDHLDSERLHDVAVDWVRRNQAAFCSGYAAAAGIDPGTHRILLRALILDKAVYEVMYEARHRPGWLAIPLGSIADS